MSTVIKVENLSKQYRLGTVGASTFKEDAQRWFAKIRGKQDPFLNVGSVNDRTLKDDSKFVWSLKDINFEVQQGDVLGVVGRNGAGKSTLLKILSKVTAPTTGSVKVKGRIASLLEVGTGFHPELTGRENIYLNGAILGMRKHEITRKLDEIIAFAGVEKYVDTPVKRYSSGMYVRLAFAVAAHLESEILIVDEVLAVGDFDFQKKCLGKMGDLSRGEGRTVLFVSHNIASIQNLCSVGFFLENGKIKLNGKINDVVSNYYNVNNDPISKISEIENREGNGFLKFQEGFLFCENEMGDTIDTFKTFKIVLTYEIQSTKPIIQFRFDIGINNSIGDRIAWMSTDTFKQDFDINSNKIEFIVNDLPFSPGEYYLSIYCEINYEVSDWLKEVMYFTIPEKDYYNSGKLIPKNQGNILLHYKYR